MRINTRVCIRGLERGPCYHQKVMWVVKNLKNKKENKGKRKNMKVRVGSIRIVDFVLSVPPSLPMVFLVRSYARGVRMPRLGGVFDGAQIASPTLDELNCHSEG